MMTYWVVWTRVSGYQRQMLMCMEDGVYGGVFLRKAGASADERRCEIVLSLLTTLVLMGVATVFAGMVMKYRNGRGNKIRRKRVRWLDSEWTTKGKRGQVKVVSFLSSERAAMVREVAWPVRVQ
jgi:hypothetical protein